MIVDDRRVRIVTGHYGSGKTEFAVNYAVQLVRQSCQKVALADMDIVNVYFRSREVRNELCREGIKVIDSSIGASADIPAIPAETYAPFEDKRYNYIIDLGGNDVGTIVLGRYKEFIDPNETDFFMVVNVFRPDTNSVEKILKQKESLEKSSGLCITGFINNSNLVWETQIEDVLHGNEMLSKVSEVTGIPVKYTSYVKEAVDIDDYVKSKLLGEIFPMKFYMRKEWM